MERDEQLQRACGLVPLVADVAHAVATIYVPALAEGRLTVLAAAKPNTCFILYKPRQTGVLIPAADEPVVWRTLQSGDGIHARREWALNMDALDMETIPIRDESGHVAGVVSFETSQEEAGFPGHELLRETAYLLLTGSENASGHVYRPLSARDGILVVDENGTVILANAAAASIYKILGVSQIVGRRIYDRHVNLSLVQAVLATGDACEKELTVSEVVLVERAIPVLQQGKVVRVIVVVSDVTELKKKERELLIKSAVIQEIHHRVKNNLQTIASLLRLQSRRAQSPEVKAALQESVNRILSISVVHEFLSQQDEEYIDVAVVSRNILELVVQNMLEPGFQIETEYTGGSVILPSDRAATLALIVNELVQNAIEHGFAGRQRGRLMLGIHVTDAKCRLEIADDGNGLPDGFHIQESGNLGLQIVRTLVEEDLNGKIIITGRQGTQVVIEIPREGKDSKGGHTHEDTTDSHSR